MKKEEAYYLGKIIKPYGIKGEVLVKLDTDEPENYEGMESVFLEIGGKLVPFFINDSFLHKSLLLRVDFEDVDSIEQAEKLVGRKLYLPLSELPELTGKNFYYHEILGFKAIDKRLGPIGLIKSVNDMAAQPYMIILHPEGKEILVPIHNDMIEKVDREQKEMHLTLPDGLVDVYLQSGPDTPEEDKDFDRPV